MTNRKSIWPEHNYKECIERGVCFKCGKAIDEETDCICLCHWKPKSKSTDDKYDTSINLNMCSLHGCHFLFNSPQCIESREKETCVAMKKNYPKMRPFEESDSEKLNNLVTYVRQRNQRERALKDTKECIIDQDTLDKYLFSED